MAKRSAKCPQCGNRVELEAQTGELIACPQCQAHLTVNIHKTAERDHTKKPAAPADPLIGKTLCEFEILALLGRGGMGAVYRAKDTKLDRQVAVKVLAPQYARDPKFVQRFEREARAAAAVNHTNIIQIHSVGEDGGHRYIVMELVEGLTLADVLRADGAMPVKRAMTVMKQLASALAEAHGKGVIHRDVKPANIILAGGDQVKVTDFGIAKRPDVDVNVTQAGKLMGTAMYLPPETARGKPFDARSDLYSLGITFYEMLSGRPPFQGGTTAELIAHHLETEPPGLSESAPHVPSSLCRLVHRLLSKDPAGRHQSASELLTALEGLSGASRIAPQRSAGKVPTAKKAERPKLLIPGVIVAAVLAIGIGFVLIFVLGGDDPGPKDGEPPSVAKPHPEPPVKPVVAKPKPKPPPPVTPKPKPPTPKAPVKPEPLPDDNERWTEWEDLFDGKTLRGWVGNQRLWTVTNGMIVGRAGGLRQSEYLVSERSFGDFILRFEGRVVNGQGNSGMQFRSTRLPGSTTVVGYQLDIGSARGYDVIWGALYDDGRNRGFLARPSPVDIRRVVKPSDWNNYEVKAIRDEITLSINGVQIIQYTERDPSIPRWGVIGPQVSRVGPLEAHFRNIRVRRLKPAAAKRPPKEPRPPWKAAWPAAKAKADGLLKAQRFGEALATYEKLGKRYGDAHIQQRIRQTVGDIRRQADAAWRQAQGKAKTLRAQGKVDQARAALQPVIDRHGIPRHEQEARKLLAEIARAPRTPTTRPVAIKPTPETRPAPTPADDLRRRREAQYARALRPVEVLVAAWDFRGAEAALAKLTFKDKELAERLATRRDEAVRLAKLKAKMIEQIKKAKPWLQKRSVAARSPEGVKIRTVGARVVDAGDAGLTVHMTDKDQDKTEVRKWPSLSGATVQRFVRLAVDDKSADDHLAAGILALARNDLAAAEKHFEKARTLGAKIDRYLGPLAAVAFAKAKALLEAKKYAEADEALAALEKKYGKTPWFASHKHALDAVRARVKSAIAEAEAEELYAQAVKFLEKKAVWDLKPVVEKLKTSYAKTAPVTDTKRKPSFVEMAKAVAGLGKFLTVRQDGKGDHKTIQAAIDVAPPNSLIEIQDSGRYLELIEVTKREGLTLRGKPGAWPIIAAGRKHATDSRPVILVRSPRTTIEGLVLLHGARPPEDKAAVLRLAVPCLLRSCLVHRPVHGGARGLDANSSATIEGCALIAPVRLNGISVVRNSLILHSHFYAEDRQGKLTLENVLIHVVGYGLHTSCPVDVSNATIAGMHLGFPNEPNVVRDSIVDGVHCEANLTTQVEYCNLNGRVPLKGAKAGKGCFRGDPQFVDPKNHDFRLKRTSPCKGKASDGGDVGVRFTPEVVRMLRMAFELRKKGLIKF